MPNKLQFGAERTGRNRGVFFGRVGGCPDSFGNGKCEDTMKKWGGEVVY